MNKELLKGSTVTLILKLLNQEPSYGYGLIKKLDLISEGVFSLKEGTLYPILHSLEKKGFIESYWDTKESKRKRKYYKITDKGKKKLKEKKREWTIFSDAMETVLGED
ncbi:MAG: PadR family transcriptional regulator [Firmicutes bacterium]|nr:PadR family transcriptional regulator [Bacillota bacterium]